MQNAGRTGSKAKQVALGVSGGISAYKAAEVARELQQRGLEVQVILTAHGQEFIRPLTFAALTGRKVITGMFGSGPQEANVESAIEHVAVAQSIDLLLVAPATADILAKFAHGIADDFLATLYLATQAPVVVAPAMNVNMWEHPATRENLDRLRSRGVSVVEPEAGYLACGMTGPGRLASPEAIVQRVMQILGLGQGSGSGDLQGEVVLVTAGPTRERIDAVRYISNRSSGKMGYAVAAAAQRRGARTILVSGPTALQPPPGVEYVPVTTAAEMRAAVLARLPESTVVIKAAAVADFRAPAHESGKIRRTGQGLTLVLEPTEDILAEIGRQKGSRILVGFAAETGDPVASAQAKLERKNLDLVVANDVSREGSGFDSDYNEVVLVGRNGNSRRLPRLKKDEVAQAILDELPQLRSHGKP